MLREHASRILALDTMRFHYDERRTLMLSFSAETVLAVLEAVTVFAGLFFVFSTLRDLWLAVRGKG